MVQLRLWGKASTRLLFPRYPVSHESQQRKPLEGMIAVPDAAAQAMRGRTVMNMAQVNPTRGFKTLPAASATIKGLEVMRMIRKWQCLMQESGATGEVRFVSRLFRRLIRREGRGKLRFTLTNATGPVDFAQKELNASHFNASHFYDIHKSAQRRICKGGYAKEDML
jgi:hypothetical protein